MQTIKLDRNKVCERIRTNYGGSHGHGWDFMLIVSPDAAARTVPVQASRPWDPWHEGDFVAPLPAPYGDGSTALYELAEQMFADYGELEDALRRAEDGVGLVEAAEDRDPETWAAYQAEDLGWYAAEWLKALNGEPNDLDITAAWGHRGDPLDGAGRIEPPFRFAWKEDL